MEILMKIQVKITIIVTQKKKILLLLLFVNVNRSNYANFLIRCWLQPLLRMSGVFTIRSMWYTLNELIN